MGIMAGISKYHPDIGVWWGLTFVPPYIYIYLDKIIKILKKRVKEQIVNLISVVCGEGTAPPCGTWVVLDMNCHANAETLKISRCLGAVWLVPETWYCRVKSREWVLGEVLLNYFSMLSLTQPGIISHSGEQWLGGAIWCFQAWTGHP